MNNPRDMNVVAEIKKRYGHVIDLDKSPMTIIEIIHNFRYLLDGCWTWGDGWWPARTQSRRGWNCLHAESRPRFEA